jgi:hypothetical protein
MTDNFNAENAERILAECVISVFGEMAFIDVVRSENDKGSASMSVKRSKDERRAAIDVLAPLTCRIELKINTPLRDRITETLFGEIGESEIKKTAEDPLLEMLNIIAGTFLSSYFGSGTDIQLELPRYLYSGEQSSGQEIAALRMDAEGEPVDVILSSVRYRY